MKRIIFLLPILFLGASCPKPDRSQKFPEGLMLTDPGATSLAQLPDKKADPKYDAEVKGLIEAGYKCILVDARGGKVVSGRGTEKLKDLKIKEITQTPFVDFRSKQYFSANVKGDFGYASLVASGDAKYEELKEIQLDRATDPEFSLKFEVNPIELFALQEAVGNGTNRYVLFQRDIAAPSIAYSHTLKSASATADVPVVFHGAANTISDVSVSHNRRLVLRKYANKENIPAILTSGTNMFIETTDNQPVQHGKDGVGPRQLRFNYKGKKYRVSQPYEQHLVDEEVTFKVPADLGQLEKLIVDLGTRPIDTNIWTREQFEPVRLKSIDELNKSIREYGKEYGGSGGKAFSVAARLPSRITQVQVSHDRYVDGILLKTEQQKLKQIGGTDGREHSFTLAADEVLTRVDIEYDRFVDRITFHTSKGKTFGPYGGPGGKKRARLQAPAGYKIVGFRGASDRYLDRIGLIVQPE